MASPRELNQVFLNLLDNSIRAGSKNIWIRTADDGEPALWSLSERTAAQKPTH